MSTLLSVEGLSLARGNGGGSVLHALSLKVARGEICALMGPSGCGKTTTLRAIAGLQPFDAGTIEVDGFSLAPGPVPPESRLGPLRERVGMVFQGHALFEHLTALHNVMLALVHARRRSATEAETRAREQLDALGVAGRAGAYPQELSGGEAQRVAIARALVLDPPLLLMDEPTAALDPARRGALADTLKGLARNGRGLLIATHDVDFARACTNRTVVLGNGG
jgi:ABC-type polar amino acid transport system ATPase subunit